MDFVLLEDRGSRTSLLTRSKAAAGLAGLLMLGWAARLLQHSHFPSLSHPMPAQPSTDTAALQLSAPRPSAPVVAPFMAASDRAAVPKRGISSVLVSNSAPGPLQFFAPLALPGMGPTAVFIYGIDKSRLEKNYRARAEVGWIYGAKLYPTRDGSGDLTAVRTGDPADVLAGCLLSWPSEPAAFPHQLSALDTAEKYDPHDNTPGRRRMRGMAAVVLSDGTTRKAYWYYQTSPPAMSRVLSGLPVQASLALLPASTELKSLTRTTWLGGNSWHVMMAGRSIAIDPWFEGTMQFFQSPFILKGMRPAGQKVDVDGIDLLLLTQALQDHTHVQTLRNLPRSIPVVAAPLAGKICRMLGFEDVRELRPGDRHTLRKERAWETAVEVVATPGDLGQNGYVISAQGAPSLYYEPHGTYSEQLGQMLAELAPVDICVAPALNLSLPVVGQVVPGESNALALARSMQPRFWLEAYWLQTIKTGKFAAEFKGFLPEQLVPEGSALLLNQKLNQAGLATQVIEPFAGQYIDVYCRTISESKYTIELDNRVR
eukprot:g37969.t1